MIQKDFQFKSQRVTYKNVNLWDMKGTIITKLPQAPYNNGQFCLVRWDGRAFDAVEWKENLLFLED